MSPAIFLMNVSLDQTYISFTENIRDLVQPDAFPVYYPYKLIQLYLTLSLSMSQTLN